MENSVFMSDAVKAAKERLCDRNAPRTSREKMDRISEIYNSRNSSKTSLASKGRLLSLGGAYSHSLSENQYVAEFSELKRAKDDYEKGLKELKRLERAYQAAKKNVEALKKRGIDKKF